MRRPTDDAGVTMAKSVWISKKLLDDNGDWTGKFNPDFDADEKPEFLPRDRFCVGFRDLDGKLRRKNSAGKGKEGLKSARIMLADIQRRLDNNTYSEGKKKDPTSKGYTAACEEFLADLSARAKREATIEAYRPIVARFWDFCKPRSTGAITAETVTEYKTLRLKLPGPKRASKVMSSTLNKDLRHLRAFFAFCVRRGYMAKLPIDMRQDRAVEERPAKRLMTDEHLRAIYVAGRHRQAA
jgi:hypothetical protein